MGNEEFQSFDLVRLLRGGEVDVRAGARLALIAALAGLAVAGLTLSIAILMGEQFPTIMPGRAFDTAIPVELLIVPLGVAVAVMETGRFLAVFRHRRGQIVASGRPQVIPVNESKRAS